MPQLIFCSRKISLNFLKINIFKIHVFTTLSEWQFNFWWYILLLFQIGKLIQIYFSIVIQKYFWFFPIFKCWPTINLDILGYISVVASIFYPFWTAFSHSCQLRRSLFCGSMTSWQDASVKRYEYHNNQMQIEIYRIFDQIY